MYNMSFLLKSNLNNLNTKNSIKFLKDLNPTKQGRCVLPTQKKKINIKNKPNKYCDLELSHNVNKLIYTSIRSLISFKLLIVSVFIFLNFYIYKGKSWIKPAAYHISLT